MAEPRLQIEAPKRFGAKEIVVANLFSLAAVSAIVSFSALVVLMHVVSVRVDTLAVMLSFSRLTAPMGLLILYFALTPFLMAIPYIRHLLRNSFGSRPVGTNCFDCQITLSPRLCTGLRGLIDDADDIGRLDIYRDSLVFTGDHVHLCLPFDSITSATSENCGGRRLWILGNRIVIRTDDLIGLTGFYLNERQSNTTAGSHQIAKELFRSLQERMNGK